MPGDHGLKQGWGGTLCNSWSASQDRSHAPGWGWGSGSGGPEPRPSPVLGEGVCPQHHLTSAGRNSPGEILGQPCPGTCRVWPFPAPPRLRSPASSLWLPSPEFCVCLRMTEAGFLGHLASLSCSPQAAGGPVCGPSLPMGLVGGWVYTWRSTQKH